MKTMIFRNKSSERGDTIAAKYKSGDIAYLLEPNRFVREVRILKAASGFYTIRFLDSGEGIKVRENRLYASKEEAEKASKDAHPEKKTERLPWDYV